MSTTPDPMPPRQSGPSGLRIGDAERNAAADALQQHLTSGRLTLDEYADRAAVVSAARTQGEVDAVFGDLPPIAGAPGAAGTLATSAFAAPTTAIQSSPAPAFPAAAPASGPNRALLVTIVSAMPFIALILFFAFDLPWYVFLLIPLTGAVLGPMIGDRDDKFGRNRDRDRNR